MNVTINSSSLHFVVGLQRMIVFIIDLTVDNVYNKSNNHFSHKISIVKKAHHNFPKPKGTSSNLVQPTHI